MDGLDNTPERYGSIAVALHWLAAVLIFGLLVLGLYMVALPDAGYDKTKIVLFIYHKEFGLLVFFMALVRLVWRWRRPLPHLEPAPDWQKVAARFTHLGLYALMLALPLTGWLMSSAAAMPVSFFGLGYVPDLLPRDDLLFHAFIAMHHWLAYALIAALVAHVGAALWHALITRDATLDKMLPPRSGGAR
jgi:cytochrome b561